MDAASGRFDGLTALVTGSTSGIGLAIADAIEQLGGRVIRHGLETDSGHPDALRTDLGATGGGAALAAQALAIAPIDILVLSASLQVREPWLSITSEQVSRQLQVNFVAALELMQAVVPGMTERGWGRILTIGSVQQSRKPHRDMAVYAASKAAQFNLVVNLAKQLAPAGVTVNNVSPGVIETPRNTDVLSSPDYLRATLDGIPAGRIGVADDCVPAALMLCSPAGGYVTGQDIIVDGGMTL